MVPLFCAQHAKLKRRFFSSLRSKIITRLRTVPGFHRARHVAAQRHHYILHRFATADGGVNLRIAGFYGGGTIAQCGGVPAPDRP